MRTLKSILAVLTLSAFIVVGCKNNENNENHGHDHEKNTEHVETKTKQDDHGHDHDAHVEHADMQENEASITIKANSALEYKFKINEGEALIYDWTSTGALNFDFHGDPTETEKFPKGFFKSYAKGTSTGEKGSEKMPFQGSHGWYWKNTTDEDVKITLKTKGNYIIIGKIQ